MIIGTGIDIIEVARVEEKVARNNGFTEKVFSPAERAFCEAQRHPYQHYAARFAAKEAFLKATGRGLQAGLDLCDIEIVQAPSGQPVIQLHGDFKQQAEVYGWNKIHVSLSHVGAMACAMVILEQ
ncbi:holo-ACP synthase [Dawidia soli]|uniref:Holo-[acyl-carrier-protein] synthase n=1 Tax=Dawidia soli TaxID=2782352 RepID=A0AAP2GC17_9BACT|nr:holo-ACP synthase [Dawidia soli]MBT1685717.1 holo-ACP synthase [Dawidia soli]